MSNPDVVFVTGTDTNIGKTVATATLLCKEHQLGRVAVGLKPVASGCTSTESGLRNIDAELLKRKSALPLTYDQINPIQIEPPVSPHFFFEEAFKKRPIRFNVNGFAEECLSALPDGVDLVLVEGAGGWRAPLAGDLSFAELAKAFTHRVVLVVGVKLGCLNHARLTIDAIERDGLELAGWVANCVEPEMLLLEENILHLEKTIAAPRLLTLPFIERSNDSDESMDKVISRELSIIDSVVEMALPSSYQSLTIR